MADEIITAVMRPTAALYNSSVHHTFTGKSFDGNMGTYDTVDAGAGQGSALLLPLKNLLPAGVTLTEATYRLTLHRKDNAGYCALKCALGYAEDPAAARAPRLVTNELQLPLSAYNTAADTSGTQAITPEQSAALMGAAYPALWISVMGRHYCYGIEVTLNGVKSDEKLYVGGEKAGAVYVGCVKAGAAYLGTTRIL